MKLSLLALVVGLQAAWMLGTVFQQERRLAEGQLILLETRPVDPRDLLRGDYVILGYDISLVPTASVVPPAPDGVPIEAGSPVFVELRQEGEFHTLHRASLTSLDPDPGNVVLRGRVSSRSWADRGETLLRVQYGLERYYVREGTGNPIGKLTVQVAVARSGNALIKQVFLDGVPYVEAMKLQVP
ncbi:MAG: GDYXXLXY domain-containing protein [Limisphaerales bacterium]